MVDGAGSLTTRALAWLRGDPTRAAIAVGVALLTGYVLGYPLSLVRYPPIVDLPFHAAETAILAHYTDPAWHFHEQFTIHPIQMPYVAMYGVGALLDQVLPAPVATKGMALSMLVLPPLGLGVLAWGMRKSPLIGVAALALTWNTLTEWGFLNFLGATGLMAACVGIALRIVDRPSRPAQIALGCVLAATFFTHVYRVPFSVLSVIGAGVVMYPATQRFRPLLAPLVPVIVLFTLWQLVRDRELLGASVELGFDPSRLVDFRRHVFGAYAPPDGMPPTPLGDREAWLSLQTLGWLVAATVFAFVTGRRDRSRRTPDGGAPNGDRAAEDRRFRRHALLVVVMVIAGLVVTYVSLPFQIAEWFYVYPREAVAIAYFALALVPDMPRQPLLRATTLALLALAAVPMTQFVATQYLQFEHLTRDFREILQKIPRAPKLLYLVYERRGTMRRVSPFLHLPAWVQAEKGGWLSFHLVQWNHSLIRYRTGSEAVPPALPDRFEWRPQDFRMQEHGSWFDTFLIRHAKDPSVLFESDPAVHLVEHRGTWWLYRRDDAAN